MNRDSVDFRVTQFAARVPDGVPIVWKGCEMSTGLLVFDLDDSAGNSGGVMDYGRGLVSAEFHVRLRFPHLAAVLEAQGADPEMTLPVRATLRAEGEVLSDHSFAGGLRGQCDVQPHGIFSSEGIRVEVLPGL